MSSTLVAALHQEERSIIAELRASRPYQRLEGIRSLLELYDSQPSVAMPLEAGGVSEPGRPSAMIHPIVSSAPIPMPGPTIAETAVADAARTSATMQGPIGFDTGTEPASVVSSVRAALLGIGKP